MRFVAIAAFWLVAAIVIGASGTLERLRPPAPQLILAGLAIALIAIRQFNRTFRAWIDQLDIRALVALHLTRLVGFYFLFLYKSGELPYGFAVPAGLGDISVALWAGLLLLFWPHLTRAWLLAWNTFGLVDILFVIVNAARHGMEQPASMAPLLHLPLSLLPTFLVPLIIASHIFIFSRIKEKS